MFGLTCFATCDCPANRFRGWRVASASLWAGSVFGHDEFYGYIKYIGFTSGSAFNALSAKTFVDWLDNRNVGFQNLVGR